MQILYIYLQYLILIKSALVANFKNLALNITTKRTDCATHTKQMPITYHEEGHDISFQNLTQSPFTYDMILPFF
jgi:hypothetical protein